MSGRQRQGSRTLAFVTRRRWLAAASGFLLPVAARAGAVDSPIGLWRTFDDHTGQARGLVRIFPSGGVLHGRIEQLLDTADQRRVCSLCSDDQHNQPILGLEIIRDLHPAGAGWAGHVLDPQTGSLYRCTAHLAAGGRSLVLRGYVLLPLLGRSQTWQRVGAGS